MQTTPWRRLHVVGTAVAGDGRLASRALALLLSPVHWARAPRWAAHASPHVSAAAPQALGPQAPRPMATPAACRGQAASG